MPLNTARIKAICFDIDGTLRDTDDYYVQKIARRLRPIRKMFPGQDQFAFARKLVMQLEGPINRIFAFADQLGLDGLLHRIVEWVTSGSEEGETNSSAMVLGAYPLIEHLAKDYPLAIITTRSAQSTKRFLQQNKLLSFFGPIASALTTQKGKPNADPILWVAKQMNVPATNCLMVGDTVMDIQSGIAAGAQTLAVLSGFGEEEELKSSGATIILKDVAEMAKIFSKK